MAEHLGKRPSKSILKTSSSFDSHEAPRPNKETKWDEMNIIATLHPPEKDYGHMKIDEPKTPYNYEGFDKHEEDELDSSAVSEKLSKNLKPKIFESSSNDEDDEPPEVREKRKIFEAKRKGHYREWEAVQRARKLLEEDEDEDEDEGGQDEKDEESETDEDDNGSEQNDNSNHPPKMGCIPRKEGNIKSTGGCSPCGGVSPSYRKKPNH